MRGMLGDDPTLVPVDSNAPRTTVAEAMVQANYHIAEDLVGSDPNLGDMGEYVHDGTLMTIDQVPPNHTTRIRPRDEGVHRGSWIRQRDDHVLPGVPERRRHQRGEGFVPRMIRSTRFSRPGDDAHGGLRLQHFITQLPTGFVRRRCTACSRATRHTTSSRR